MCDPAPNPRAHGGSSAGGRFRHRGVLVGLTVAAGVVSAAAAPPATPPIPLDVARDRARTMHDVLESTLDVIHHRYFHVDRAMLPARAMEDIFADVRRKSRVGARWVAVNTRAMSLDHEPQDDFEKRVARELAAGAEEVEAIEGTVYRRAAPIPLGGGCISCHEGLVQQRPDLPRLAALVIRVPGIVPPEVPAGQADEASGGLADEASSGGADEVSSGTRPAAEIAGP